MATSVEQLSLSSLKLDGGAKNALTFEPFDLPAGNQRVLGAPHPGNCVTPLALRPSIYGDAGTDLDAVVESIKSLQAQDGILTKKLSRHGTILFRGLPIHNAEDFSKFAHAFGYKPHEIIGIVVDRPLLAPNVAPASALFNPSIYCCANISIELDEAPKEVLIYNHNESPQVPHAPEYVFFYSHRAPAKGGETPISSSLELFHRARQEIPDFIEELASKGVLSRVVYKPEKQYDGGSTLKQAFGKEILDTDSEATQREKIEAQIKRYARDEHTTWEWTPEDHLILTHHLPVIRTQPETNLPTLFTGLAAYHRRNQLDSSARKNAQSQLFGDGTPIPERYLDKLVEITEDIKVLHKWQRGDVLVYDNIISQHGRQPWEGEQADRVVLASLWDGASVPGPYGEQSWASVVQALEG